MAAFSVTPQASPLGAKLVEIPSASETVCANVTGGAGILYNVDIDNEGNAGEDIYVKLFDTASVTLGTTVPDWVFLIKGGTRRSYVIPEGIAFAALSVAAVLTGGTVGATPPTSAVPVRLVTS